ncbi:MAG: carboxypeptidase regulatory-like domain-containing protein [Thermodesulfobacteria bacterium]|nr:carboxypeptidase regulatory-like domain-containing protein [Thermodesulfobacteriota bacterium]
MYAYFWILVLAFLRLLLHPFPGLAHGVVGKIEYQGKCVIVIAQYDTGEPMSYAKVDVYAPDSKIRFQLGRTDRNGCFAFVPDVPGIWKVRVYDGMGHLLSLSIKVSKKSLTSFNKACTYTTSTYKHRWIKAILGIFIILGIFGWIKTLFRFKKAVS